MNAELASKHLGQMLENGQAQSGSSFLSGLRSINPVKTFGDSRQVGGRNALAGILHLQSDAFVSLRMNLKRDGASGRCIGNGIIYEVNQNLNEPIPVRPRLHLFVDMIGHL